MSESNTPIDDFVSYHAMFLADAPNDAQEPPEDENTWRIVKKLAVQPPWPGHAELSFTINDLGDGRLVGFVYFTRFHPDYGCEYRKRITIDTLDEMTRQFESVAHAGGLTTKTVLSALPFLEYVVDAVERFSDDVDFFH